MNFDRFSWREILLAGVISFLFLLCSSCALTAVREDTGTSPLEDAVSTAVGQAATGNWIGAVVGGIGTLVGGAGAVYAQRKRKEGKQQLAEVVDGVSRYVEGLDAVEAQRLYEALSQAMDRKTKERVRALKAQMPPERRGALFPREVG